MNLREFDEFRRFESVAVVFAWLVSRAFRSSTSSGVSRAFQRCLEAVWLEIFGPVFLGSPGDTDPRDRLISPGPTPRINLQVK